MPAVAGVNVASDIVEACELLMAISFITWNHTTLEMGVEKICAGIQLRSMKSEGTDIKLRRGMRTEDDYDDEEEEEEEEEEENEEKAEEEEDEEEQERRRGGGGGWRGGVGGGGAYT